MTINDIRARMRAQELAADRALGEAPRVQWRTRGRLDAPAGGTQLLGASVAPDGQLVVAWADHDRAMALVSHGTAPPVALPSPRPGSLQPHVLPGGRILLTARRTRHPDANAFVYDDRGQLVAEGMLGDGISHVTTTGAGAIWVGYFDEGVYGNDGWQTVGLRPSAGGLARFTATLDPDAVFSPPPDFGPVDDCYAINVVGEAAVAYYYSSWPIVRMSAEQGIEGWHTSIASARALVLTGVVVALIGASFDRHVVVGRLTDGEFVTMKEMRMDAPIPIASERDMLVARGDELHVLADGHWQTLAMSDILTAAGVTV